MDTLRVLRAALAGRYDVERELGRGGMATVYLARDLRHGRTVAVKVLDQHLSHESAERFLHEIRIAAQLTHPHIVSVHESGEADGVPYYVMPYMEGETLRDLLARAGALPLRDALRLLRELADAVAHAHAHGVVHRDLKPENVLLSGGHAAVADFGIAKAMAVAVTTEADREAAPAKALTAAGVSLGTPAYMAPEQAVADAGVDHRADLYALGVIAYEILAGAHPFGSRTSQALVAAHLSEAPTPLGQRRAELPQGVAALVMRLLEKDPAERPQSAREVLHALEESSTGPHALPSDRDRFRRIPVLAAAGVMLVALAAIWWWRGSDGAARSAEGATSLAVLPFVNTGGSAEDEYFSDGLTDELAHALARLPGLRLAGRTSTYAFKGRTASPQEIGRTLDVGAFITGTVRRAGDRIRVATQLVSTADGKVIGEAVSETRTGDVFAVQDELTRTIILALAPALGDNRPTGPGDAARGTTNQAAYDAYLRGRYYWTERGAENVARAIEHMREAVALDPQFARAHAGLALAYAVLSVYVVGASDTSIALAAASARRAIALDSTVADAQLAMGIALEDQHRYDEALARYRRAIALEPWSASAHHVFGFALLSHGRTDESVAALRRSVELDPLAKSPGSTLGTALLAARRFPESIAVSRRILALDSTFTLALANLGRAQVFGGYPDSAVGTLERAVALYPDAPQRRSELVLAYAAAGRWDDAERQRDALRGLKRTSEAIVADAVVALVFGDREPLVRLLSTKEGRKSWLLSEGYFGCNPVLDPLWTDNRFQAAMREHGVETCRLARPWPLQLKGTQRARAAGLHQEYATTV